MATLQFGDANKPKAQTSKFSKSAELSATRIFFLTVDSFALDFRFIFGFSSLGIRLKSSKVQMSNTTEKTNRKTHRNLNKTVNTLNLLSLP